jgi:Ca2+-binding RTX toxin-like protein
MSDLILASVCSPTKTLDPKKRINGYAQDKLGDEWWKTVYQIPATENFGLFSDELDPNGRRGSVEKALKAQFGESVLFIGGAYGEVLGPGGGTFERTIVLPNNGDATVFFPLLNAAYDNLTNTEGEGGNKTDVELKTTVSSDLDQYVSDLFASVDGKEIPNPFEYRQASGVAFYYATPYPVENSLLGSIGYTNDTYLDNADADPITLEKLAESQGIPGQVTIGPAVSDGYWLAVDVKGGDHTLNFGGAYNFGFALNITYNILNPIYGGNGKEDILYGTCGNDYIDGGNRSDKLMGLKGDDLIVGGAGADVIDGGKGNDELWGDAGIDTFIFERGYGKDKIFDFTSGEKVEIPGLPVRSSRGVTDITLPSGEDAAQIKFGGGDILTFVGVQSSDLNIQRGLITFA